MGIRFFFLCDGQMQMHFSPLGSKLHFHVNSSRKNSLVLTSKVAAVRNYYVIVAGKLVT